MDELIYQTDSRGLRLGNWLIRGLFAAGALVFLWMSLSAPLLLIVVLGFGAMSIAIRDEFILVYADWVVYCRSTPFTRWIPRMKDQEQTFPLEGMKSASHGIEDRVASRLIAELFSKNPREWTRGQTIPVMLNYANGKRYAIYQNMSYRRRDELIDVINLQIAKRQGGPVSDPMTSLRDTVLRLGDIAAGSMDV